VSDEYNDDIQIIDEDGVRRRLTTSEYAEEEEFSDDELSRFGKSDVMRLPRSYRSESSGIPIGRPPELVRGNVIYIDPPLDGNGPPIAALTIDDLNDPDIVTATAKYASNPTMDTPDEIKDKMVAAYTEAARMKAARKRAAKSSKAATKPEPTQTACVVVDDKKNVEEAIQMASLVDVEWDYGPYQVTAGYTEVIINDNIVVLAMSDAAKAAGIHIPKPQDESIRLTPANPEYGVDSLWVFPTGTSFTHNGYTYAVLFIDRDKQ